MTPAALDRMLAEIGVVARPEPKREEPRPVSQAPWKPKHPGDQPPF